MNKILTTMTAALLGSATLQALPTHTPPPSVIGKHTAPLTSDRLTPEALWAMGRIGAATLSPDGSTLVYTVSYYSVQQNKAHTVLYLQDVATQQTTLLTTTADNETSPAFLQQGKVLTFLSNASGSYQVWALDLKTQQRTQLTSEDGGINDYLFAPNGREVLLIKDIAAHHSIAAPEEDLPLASGMVVNDMMYRHWDHYVTSVPHPFIAHYDGQTIKGAKDIMANEPYEAPLMPFGGTEQFAWSPDSKSLAYTSRKKTGRDYAISTDSDIYLYDLTTQLTTNLCKPADYVAPVSDPTRSLQDQPVNHQPTDYNVGYDTNPQFSPDGQRIAWLSMARDGYESDRNRLCVYDRKTGNKSYVTESFDSGVDGFLWAPDNKTIYFTGVWHGMTNIYRTNLRAQVQQLTQDTCDYALVALTDKGRTLLAKKHSISQADELYLVHVDKKRPVVQQITKENQSFYDQLTMGRVTSRWVPTVDGKKELCWVIYPPHFDPNKQYPTLLYCQGGPQQAVSQFWSFRWNFQIMAANDYIIIAPNRRGLPGFGQEWLEAISGDYAGACMQDYLSAIDDIAREPYVDRNRLGAVGASFGAYSIYWLAGNHNKRFKCFIAHDGIFNTQQQYLETEEMWFANWDLKGAPWHKDDKGQAAAVYTHSPHLYVEKWDTPILGIHGMKDFRILNSQTEAAFQAARLRGVPAQMLLFPDENHWVVKPQNGVLWQRTFFRWLDKWLK